MNKLLLAIGLLVPALAFAQVPQTMHYQGFLTSNTGVPIDGEREATFSIYAVPSGGAPLWQEQLVVNASNGRFQVVLGNVTPIALAFDTQYWLGVKAGLDPEMTPRQALTASPYALRARSLDSAAQVQGLQITGTISGATISGGTLTQLQTQFAPAVSFAPPQSNTSTAIPGIGGVGGGTSITIGNDGLPAITFWDNNSQLLRFIKCTSASCSTSNTVTVDTGGGSYNSLAIGADGLPVMSYRASGVKVARCSDAACAGSKSTATVDAASPNFFYTSVGIASDGLPVVAYHDSTNNRVKVAKCNEPACQNPAATVTAVTANATGGHYLSMAIGIDGLPVIAFWNGGFNVLNVVKCANPSCTGNPAPNPVAAVPPVLFGEISSIAIGDDGLPVIAFSDQGKLRVAKCSTPDCSGASTVTFLTSTFNSGVRPALAIGADGNPVIAFVDATASGGTNGPLKLAKCANPACSTAAMSTLSLEINPNPVDISVAIGADGLPVVSYHENSEFTQKVVKCANAFCAPYFRRR